MTDSVYLRTWLTRRLAELLDVSASEVDPRAAFADLGMSSLHAFQLSGDIEHHLGRAIDPTLLYEFSTIDDLARELADPVST